MKIYCILLDVTPAVPKLLNLFSQHNFKHLHQVSNCFTCSSMVSMLTGKLPSDLLADGMGYKLWQRYLKNDHIEWPFEDEFILNKMHAKGWNITINSTSQPIYKIIFNIAVSHNKNWNRLSIFWEDEWNEKISADTVLRDSPRSRKYYQLEKEYIEKIQGSNSANSFYLIDCHHYHTAILNYYDKNIAIDRIIQTLNHWNFNEPDALFWIFTDHGNWREFDYKCTPNAYYTWAMVKDNTLSPIKINSRYISIMDFYATIANKLGIEYSIPSISSIEKGQDKDRIYFVDDSRLGVDIHKSTTAVACKFEEWANDAPKYIKQVTYFRPKNKYYGLITDSKTKVVEQTAVDIDLKEDLKNRFGWVK